MKIKSVPLTLEAIERLLDQKLAPINTAIVSLVSDISIIVDSNDTANIQESHRVIYHIICDLVEKQLSEIK